MKQQVPFRMPKFRRSVSQAEPGEAEKASNPEMRAKVQFFDQPSSLEAEKPVSDPSIDGMDPSARVKVKAMAGDSSLEDEDEQESVEVQSEDSVPSAEESDPIVPFPPAPSPIGSDELLCEVRGKQEAASEAPPVAHLAMPPLPDSAIPLVEDVAEGRSRSPDPLGADFSGSSAAAYGQDSILDMDQPIPDFELRGPRGISRNSCPRPMGLDSRGLVPRLVRDTVGAIDTPEKYIRNLNQEAEQKKTFKFPKRLGLSHLTNEQILAKIEAARQKAAEMSQNAKRCEGLPTDRLLKLPEYF